MDLLAKRYASPFLVLDEFIRLQQLHEFSMELLQSIGEEKIQEARWEFYLHRVWDMSFEEYVAKCEKPASGNDMSDNEINDVVNASKTILEGYMPE